MNLTIRAISSGDEPYEVEFLVDGDCLRLIQHSA